MRGKPTDSWRTRAAVSEALDVFNSTYMQEVWNKAIARRETDPDGAVTSARQLLESVCKHILTDAQKPFNEKLPLPQLYQLAASELEIAPSEHTAPIFSSLFKACTELVESIGRLRNHLSDAHGHGPFGSMPDWRHAELAVNLSAAMATYMAAVWAGRQPTVADVIEKYIAEAEVAEPLGVSRFYTLNRLMESPIGKVIASKVQTADVLAHWHSRRATGTKPQTVMHDLVHLRGALRGESDDAIYRAIQILRESNEVQKYVQRGRRISDEEVHALVDKLREPPKKKSVNLILNMSELVEFALWSGRMLSEICSLQWKDVDFEKKTCRLPGSTEEIPLLEGAWDVVWALKPPNLKAAKQNIFHDNAKSVGTTFRMARNSLRKKFGKDWGRGLTLNGMRHEAVYRLLEKGLPTQLVARATGQNPEKVHQVYEKIHSLSAPSESDEASNGVLAAPRQRRRRTRQIKA